AALGAVLKVLAKQGINPAGEITPYLLALSILISLAGMGWMMLSAVGRIRPPSLPSHTSPEIANTAKMKLDLLPEEMTGVTDRTTHCSNVKPQKSLCAQPHPRTSDCQILTC